MQLLIPFDIEGVFTGKKVFEFFYMLDDVEFFYKVLNLHMELFKKMILILANFSITDLTHHIIS